jgi:hypothetical protein
MTVDDHGITTSRKRQITIVIANVSTMTQLPEQMRHQITGVTADDAREPAGLNQTKKIATTGTCRAGR